jgi:prepilin-type N-terminal cleavage/methylation domain-containing protein
MKILREQGVSLLEVLVAIAILGILSGGLYSMMHQENFIVRDAAEILSAQLKANETMETLKTRHFEQLKTYSSLVVSDFNPMTVEVIVSDFKDSTTLKKIIVNVKWIDRRGHEKQFMLTTIRSQYSDNITKNSSRDMGRIVMNSAEEGGGGS